MPARLALAAVAVAAVFYFFPATISIVSWPAEGPSRMALLAPLDRLWLALAASGVTFGALGFAVRSNPVAAMRLSRAAMRLSLLLLWAVPFLPWLPDRAPLLLIFAGPLRWAVLAVAVGGAIAELIRGVHLGADLQKRLPPLGARTVFVVSLALYLVLGLRFTAAAGLSGDEPHYLVITHSLLVDHDLDIANNHERRDYRAFFGGDLRPDYLQRGQHGEIYSIHAPGLPALLVPAYAIGGSTGAVAAMAVFAALTSLAIFELATLVGGAIGGGVAWAAVCLSVPFLPHAWMIYPEGLGALIVAWSVLWIWQNDGSARRMIAHGALLALLPWMHTKFVVLLVLLAVWQCVGLWASRPTRLRSAAFFLAPVVGSIAVWVFFFYRLYGTLDPQAPYGGAAGLNRLQNIPHGTLGLLFDQKFGLLAYSPAYLLAAAGLVVMLRDARLRACALGLLVVGAAFLLSTTRFYMWWGGSSAPARFLVPLLPLLAPAIAVAVDRLRALGGRAAAVSAVLASLGIAAVCLATARADLLFSDPHGHSRLLQAMQGSAPLDVALPTFTEEHWRAPAGVLFLWLGAFGVSIGVATKVVRARLVRSVFGASLTPAFVFGVMACVLTCGGSGAEREALVDRGRLSLIHAYDATRLRPVDPSRQGRLSESEWRSGLTIGRDGLPDRPIVLPEGEYEARVWFVRDRPASGEVRVSISEHLLLARAAAPLSNPVTVRFTLPAPAPVLMTETDPASARLVRRVELAPVTLAAGAARSGADVTAVEAIEGRPLAYMSYVGETSYPEGGVFWTRGTDTARLLLVPDGAAQLRLILHVGANSGRVTIDVGEHRVDVDLAENETRDVTIPLPAGRASVPLAIRASRAFRPAAIERGSDDQRVLGVQVRPRFD